MNCGKVSATNSTDEDVGVAGCEGCEKLQHRCENIKKAWREHCVKEVAKKVKIAVDHMQAEKRKLEQDLKDSNESVKKLKETSEGLEAELMQEKRRSAQQYAEQLRQHNQLQDEKGETDRQLDRAKLIIEGYARMRDEALDLLHILSASHNVEEGKIDIGVNCNIGETEKEEEDPTASINSVSTLKGIGKMASRIGHKFIELNRAIISVNQLATLHKVDLSGQGMDGTGEPKKMRHNSLSIEDPVPPQSLPTPANDNISMPLLVHEYEASEEVMPLKICVADTPSPRTSSGTPTDPNQQQSMAVDMDNVGNGTLQPRHQQQNCDLSTVEVQVTEVAKATSLSLEQFLVKKQKLKHQPT